MVNNVFIVYSNKFSFGCYGGMYYEGIVRIVGERSKGINLVLKKL